MTDLPTFIEGGSAIDERGKLQFCNDLDMSGIKRYYLVSNFETGFVRAWHAHKLEAKYASVVTGAALFGAVEIDDWDSPGRNLEVRRYTLSEEKPGLLHIPGGYAHGFKTLTADTKVMFFTTSLVRESLGDDFRYDFDYWNPWDIVPR